MTNKEGMRFGYSCRNGKAVTTLTYLNWLAPKTNGPFEEVLVDLDANL